jgi:disulfide bond formation protein DsbB
MALLTRKPSPELLALAAGLAALAVAHLAQYAGTVPCALCYLERWPYRIAALLAAFGLAVDPARKAVRVLLLATLAAAAALAFVHVGVEAGWWRSPLPECAAPVLRTGSVHDLLASMPARPAKPCDDPTYLIPFLPISMAQMNLLYALAILVALSMSLRAGRTP